MTESPAPVGHPRPRQRARPVLPYPGDDFEVFYRREMNAVSVFLMHLGASPYEAADAAHEAFTRLLPDTWRTLEHPRAWLRTTALRCYWRQNDRRITPCDPVPDRPGGTCPVAEVLVGESQQRVIDALRRLPPAERDVMAWAMDGFTHEEISRTLGKTPAAVRQNYRRARTRLVALLGLDTPGLDTPGPDGRREATAPPEAADDTHTTHSPHGTGRPHGADDQCDEEEHRHE
ncbi:RNA polymerase sigma factor [Streptomyces sp. NPDC090022]|uniref:RNA polymerase sigma factor n=1 Tax=Streptomyces sp. NPDC090022 TaxID=3365920 RepID=UPI0037F2C8EB